jgi:hypothetical protein
MSYFSVSSKSGLLIALSVLSLILTVPAINILLDMTQGKEPYDASFEIAGSMLLVVFAVLIYADNVRKRFHRDERGGSYYVGLALFWVSVGVWLVPALPLGALVLISLSFMGARPG